MNKVKTKISNSLAEIRKEEFETTRSDAWNNLITDLHNTIDDLKSDKLFWQFVAGTACLALFIEALRIALETEWLRAVIRML